MARSPCEEPPGEGGMEPESLGREITTPRPGLATRQEEGVTGRTAQSQARSQPELPHACQYCSRRDLDGSRWQGCAGCGEQGSQSAQAWSGPWQHVWGLRTALEWRPSLQSGLEGAKKVRPRGRPPRPHQHRALFPSHPDGAAGAWPPLSSCRLKATDGGGTICPPGQAWGQCCEGPGRGSAVPSGPSAGPRAETPRIAGMAPER